MISLHDELSDFACSRTSNQLEEGEYHGRSPDYAWQLSLACLAILVCAYHSLSNV
jgi:hypothetical protein